MRFRSDVDNCGAALACYGYGHVVFEFEKFENRGRRYGFDNSLLAIGLARLPTHRLRGFRRRLEDFVEWLIETLRLDVRILGRRARFDIVYARPYQPEHERRTGQQDQSDDATRDN